MTRRFRRFALAAAAALLPCMSLSAQGTQIFKKGYTDIGVTVGLGGLGDAGVAFGGRFERAIKALPDLGNGTLGIGVSADVYSYSNRLFTYRFIPIGVTGNYHFNLENKKIVPFIGAGLGFQVTSCDYKGTGNLNLCDNSAIYFIGRAGARYFVKENLALYADVGAGAATLNIGVTFKLR